MSQWMILRCEAAFLPKGRLREFTTLLHQTYGTIVQLHHVTGGTFWFQPSYRSHTYVCHSSGKVQDRGKRDQFVDLGSVYYIRAWATKDIARGTKRISDSQALRCGNWVLTSNGSHVAAINTAIEHEINPSAQLLLTDSGFHYITPDGRGVTCTNGKPPELVSIYDARRALLARKHGFRTKEDVPSELEEGLSDATQFRSSEDLQLEGLGLSEYDVSSENISSGEWGYMPDYGAKLLDLGQETLEMASRCGIHSEDGNRMLMETATAQELDKLERKERRRLHRSSNAREGLESKQGVEGGSDPESGLYHSLPGLDL
mmetsp:Transcript_10268/g.16033  ORF Transcript_10268/g.16033 Transcript_10268/m.16033 type:complete len:316 (+) Transcript_10268:3-950(+)